MARRRYAWKPDLPDARDYRFEHAAVKLPTHVDLRTNCPPVVDQGNLGSCTANAIAGALGFLEVVAGAKPVNPYSRLFVYYQERVIEHTVKQDDGAQIRDGVKACAKLGAPYETLWPYKISAFAKKPPKVAYTDALKRRITEYSRVNGLTALRSCLAQGYPVIFGFSVYESFESDKVAHTGIVPMPKTSERMLGGHAVLAVGYDDIAERIIVRNSWGTRWGQKGYCTMPYDYVSRADLSDDFWTVRR